MKGHPRTSSVRRPCSFLCCSIPSGCALRAGRGGGGGHGVGRPGVHRPLGELSTTPVLVQEGARSTGVNEHPACRFSHNPRGSHSAVNPRWGGARPCLQGVGRFGLWEMRTPANPTWPSYPAWGIMKRGQLCFQEGTGPAQVTSATAQQAGLSVPLNKRIPALFGCWRR